MVRRAWRVRRLCVGRCVRLVGAFHRPVGHAWRSSAAAQDRDSPSAFVFFLLLCLLGFLLVFSLHMGSAPVWRGGGGLSRRRSVECGGRPPLMWRAETRTWKTRTLAQPSLAVLDFAHDKAGRCFIDGLSAYPG